MSVIHSCPLPPDALLSKYSSTGAYTDCYTTHIAKSVSQVQFVEGFYTGGVFQIERLLIRLFLRKDSTDAQVSQLAAGEAREFAAWRVEDRTPSQLLMCDIAGRTRSWLMVSPATSGTRLYFGSAVVPAASRTTGNSRLDLKFKALLGFHKLNSRILLGAARDRLARNATA